MFKEAIVSILATLAKQERIRLSERTKAGRARKVAQGVKMGPPTKSQAQVAQIQRYKQDGMSNYRIAKVLGISANTVAKYLTT
jgi:DNA invertase Pin-like site-specific DNA recombinase